MKKLVALVLSLLLVFSCMPVLGVLAEGTTEIISATYGYVSSNKDVTAVISSMLENNAVATFTVTDESMNSTEFFEESNSLVVKYSENGKTKYACVAEGSSFQIPFRFDAAQSAETQTILGQTLASSAAQKVWPDGLRGFNFDGLIGSYSANAGNEGQYVSRNTFIRLKNMGVNCLRIPIGVDYGYKWTTETIPADNPMAPYAHQLEAIKVALKLAEEYDMYIILAAGDIVGRKIDVMYNVSDGSGYNQTLIALWSYISENFGSHPNLIGYDILNEPNTDNEVSYYKNTVLPEVVSAIRENDTNTFIIVEPARFATPNAFSGLTPIADAKAVYSLHFYWPHQYTHQGIGDYTTAYTYPATMASFPTDEELYWDKAQLKASVAAVKAFQDTYNANILVGEFGVVRKAENNAQWIADAISIWEEYGWDWCYHCYGGYNGWNPTFSATASDNNIIDGNAQTDALNELEAVFSNNDADAQEEFVINKSDDNLLNGIIPTVSSNQTITTNIADESILTDGDIATSETVELAGNGYVTLVYELAKTANVKNIAFYAESNNYEIYLSDSSATLFDASNLVFARNAALTRENGRVITFSKIYNNISYVGFKIKDSNEFEISEFGVYSKLPAVEQTLVTVEKFATDHLSDNRLVDVVPTLATEDGGTVQNSTKVNDVPIWYPTTNGLYSNNTGRITITTSPNGKTIRMTYKLAHRTTVSEILFACRDNNPGSFGMEYEVYVADEKADLYNANNCVFVKYNSKYNKGGQLISFDEDIRPTGNYVGFRITGGYNSGYHIGEIGAFGTDATSILSVLQTQAQSGTPTYDGTEVQTFVTNNVANNRLASATRTVKAESGNVNSTHNATTTALVDGSYSSRETVTLSKTSSAAKMTFTLNHRTAISDLLVVSRENNTGSYRLNYEIYVSDYLDTLYNAENIVFSRLADSAYVTGGQLVHFPDDISPVGSYVGFRFTGVYYYGYHIGELGVYGSDIAPLPQVTITQADVQSFISTNSSDNMLQGLTPTYSEGHTSTAVYFTGSLSKLTDGSWDDSSRSTFGTNNGDGTIYLTYELPYYAKVSDFAMCCRGYHFANYGLSYELYFSDTKTGLYSAENKVFERLKTDAASAGQVLSFDEEIQPNVKFVGIHLIDAETYKYHVGEIMVLGSMWGDLNSDSTLDIRDLVRLKKQAANIIEATWLADLDSDGLKAGASDLTMLINKLLGVF